MLVAVFLPESRPASPTPPPSPSSAVSTAVTRAADRGAGLPPLLPWRVFRTPALRVLGVVALADELAEQLLVSLLLQYLDARFKLSSGAAAALLAEVGVVSALSLTLVLALLRRCLADFRILQLSLLANALSVGALGVAWLVWQPFVAVGGCLLAFLVFPTIAALVANAASPAEQGETQGAINGVKSLCDGLSPLLYGPLFAAFEGSSLPGGPFVVAAVVVALTLAGISQRRVADLFLRQPAARLQF